MKSGRSDFQLSGAWVTHSIARAPETTGATTKEEPAKSERIYDGGSEGPRVAVPLNVATGHMRKWDFLKWTHLYMPSNVPRFIRQFPFVFWTLFTLNPGSHLRIPFCELC